MAKHKSRPIKTPLDWDLAFSTFTAVMTHFHPERVPTYSLMQISFSDWPGRSVVKVGSNTTRPLDKLLLHSHLWSGTKGARHLTVLNCRGQSKSITGLRKPNNHSSPSIQEEAPQGQVKVRASDMTTLEEGRMHPGGVLLLTHAWHAKLLGTR